MNTSIQGFSMQGLGTTDAVVASQTEGSAVKPSIWDQINNGIKTAGAAAAVATQIKTVVSKPSSGSSSSASNPFATDADGSSTPAPVTPIDNTKKYALIAGAGVVGVTAIYFAVKASKKKGKK